MKSLCILLITILLLSCHQKERQELAFTPSSTSKAKTFGEKLSNAAISILDPSIEYDPTYFSIEYPNGDVPAQKGVCTDVIIRSYRKLDIDLQQEVHEDMVANFAKYPNLIKWGMTKTDTNIDHRRVPNLEIFFERKGSKLAITKNPEDYKTGELVTWMINRKLPHIGIITNKKSDDGERNLIVHNVGGGQVLEDCLFEYEIVGHFKYEK
ncbi:DUF1287 domain-containing protein [Flavobacterium sp. Fl-77]|uniref:DUF1287 domain-containing protein n=1 Tax=Flavobacterium flavipigmentatum TaxID=2893884 RepID=A0AAJ2SGQ9_9FLAO|nr:MULTISPECIES: DUF1287 domain-containing protein [unclassified Flavobacterium]MDX6182138.1 DUF1287 domain-containing protein [Flavobacterium sp. Fl-33]MDX6185949.1 DUF1287 domain-containing protein [Flavobacterium sp. Fl-77]UFH39125.1 DUF1287 domain-containing protein [Flavobacterium sp. F-70]